MMTVVSKLFSEMKKKGVIFQIERQNSELISDWSMIHRLIFCSSGFPTSLCLIC